MLKRLFRPAEGVSNIELFYDLIFVYCISVVTALCHHVDGGFLDLGTWLIYIFSLFTIVQVWFFSTLLMNRYGDRSISESVGLFVNMLLLYFLANGVRTEWHDTSLLFNLTWAGILTNLAVQWLIKLHTYTNLDEIDRRIMRGSAACLLIQAAISATAAFLPDVPSEIASWISLLFGTTTFRFLRLYRLKPARFSHVAERCSLLTIIAFGEMVVGISSYMTNVSLLRFPIGVFALTVGLFLIYIFEHDQMLDHHAHTDGMAYMAVSSWLIVVIGNLTVAIEYMPMTNIDFLPKSIYLTTCLVMYLLTSFLLGRYNKPEYRYSKLYVAGRLIVCAFVVVAGITTGFDANISLACHVVAVYAAFVYEYVLWHRRTHAIAKSRSLGLARELEDEEDA